MHRSARETVEKKRRVDTSTATQTGRPLLCDFAASTPNCTTQVLSFLDLVSRGRVARAHRVFEAYRLRAASWPEVVDTVLLRSHTRRISMPALEDWARRCTPRVLAADMRTLLMRGDWFASPRLEKVVVHVLPLDSRDGVTRMPVSFPQMSHLHTEGSVEGLITARQAQGWLGFEAHDRAVTVFDHATEAVFLENARQITAEMLYSLWRAPLRKLTVSTPFLRALEEGVLPFVNWVLEAPDLVMRRVRQSLPGFAKTPCEVPFELSHLRELVFAAPGPSAIDHHESPRCSLQRLQASLGLLITDNPRCLDALFTDREVKAKAMQVAARVPTTVEEEAKLRGEFREMMDMADPPKLLLDRICICRSTLEGIDHITQMLRFAHSRRLDVWGDAVPCSNDAFAESLLPHPVMSGVRTFCSDLRLLDSVAVLDMLTPASLAGIKTLHVSQSQPCHEQRFPSFMGVDNISMVDASVPHHAEEALSVCSDLEEIHLYGVHAMRSTRLLAVAAKLSRDRKLRVHCYALPMTFTWAKALVRWTYYHMSMDALNAEGAEAVARYGSQHSRKYERMMAAEIERCRVAASLIPGAIWHPASEGVRSIDGELV